MIRIYSCHFPIKQVSSFRKMKKKINPNLSEDELDSVIKVHTEGLILKRKILNGSEA